MPVSRLSIDATVRHEMDNHDRDDIFVFVTNRCFITRDRPPIDAPQVTALFKSLFNEKTLYD